MQMARPQIHVVANILGTKTGTYNQLDPYNSNFYLWQPNKPQIQATAYILIKKTGHCNWPTFKYKLQLIFMIKKQVFMKSLAFTPYIFYNYN